MRDTQSFNGQFRIATVTTGTNTFTFVEASFIGASSESSGTATHVDTSWGEIELYDVVLAGLSAYWRSQLTGHYNGYRAGTLRSLKESVKFFLGGSKQIQVKQSETELWTIEIKTLTSETVGGQTGVESDLVIAAVAFSKPAGFKVKHECVEAL